jgi:ADP-heptose:LPS heptosyltransferase/SAM-dependent methyltransferase
VLELPREVYAHDLQSHWDTFDGLFAAAREFQPNALLIAPYQWTLFDEKLAEQLPGVRRFGMNGGLYAGDPYAGHAPESRMRFDVVVEVAEDQPEVEKNAALAAVVVGEPPSEIDPRLALDETRLPDAYNLLSRLNLGVGGYWAACVTGTAHVSLKAWPAENWAELLSRWLTHWPERRFVFVGLPEEQAVVWDIRQRLGPLAERTTTFMEPGGTIDQLLGILALSAGYVGHDTGPMHLAGALGKPVLAVFGGGHRRRFFPRARPSVALTVGVSCAGCGWSCSFSTSHCVKALPVDDVWRAAQDLEEGRVVGREERVLEPGAELQARMVREAAEFAQRNLRAASELNRKLGAVSHAWERDVSDLRTQAEAKQNEATLLGAEVKTLRPALDAARQAAEQTSRHVQEKSAEAERLRSEWAIAAAAAAERAAEIDRLHGELKPLYAELVARQSVIDGLSAEAARLGGEADELRGSLRARTAELDQMRQQIDQVVAAVAQIGPANGDGARTAETENEATGVAGLGRIVTLAKRQAEELSQLREQVQKLEERMGAMEPRFRPRRPFKQVLVDWVIGPKHYTPRPPRPLPGVTIVTPVHNDEATIRRTIESVLAQAHPHLEYVIVDCGSTDGTLEVVEEYKDRVDRVLTHRDEKNEATQSVGTKYGRDAARLARAFDQARGDVLGFLEPGDVLEPGGVMRVREFFRDHRYAKAVCFDDVLMKDGWRFPAPPRPTPEVYALLESTSDLGAGIFFTRNAYASLGGLDTDRGRAAEWDFLVRLARRYGIERGRGHVRAVPASEKRTHCELAPCPELDDAKRLFEQSFGWPGRLRCRVLRWMTRLSDWMRQAGSGRRLFYPRTLNGNSLPPAEPPDFIPWQPFSVLSNRLPDRLLFSTRDTTTGDPHLSYVYYDDAAQAALAYPPVDLDRLNAMYAARTDAAKRTQAEQVVAPAPSDDSPYARWQAGPFSGLLREGLYRLPSPYWWFRRPRFDDQTAEHLLDDLAGLVPPRGSAPPVRFLNVGCYEGGLLDALKDQTDWLNFGTETNPLALAAARAKGHRVWAVSAQDAASAIPIGQSFDVIFVGHLLEHVQDPLLVLRRLRQLLEPGGLVVLSQPNLDSRHVDLFGPTWGRWQLPYHRTLLSRGALRKLAALADLRVIRLRTRTQPYPACVSVQLHELGLGAVVPDTARFPNEIASKGVRLTGWSRLLWDWRGRGDYLYAVLRHE